MDNEELKDAGAAQAKNPLSIIHYPLLFRYLRYAAVVFFAAFILMTLFLPHTKAVIPDGCSAVFCHSTERCYTCRKIEKNTQQILKKNNDIHFVSLEYDVPENREFVEKFNVSTATVILVEKKNGQIIRSSDLTGKIWKDISNDKALQKMLEQEITRF